MSKVKRRISQFFRQRRGAAAIEFALVFSLLLVLVMGIVDMGHAWYLKQVLTNASREGARYAVRYQTNGAGQHLMPNQLTPSVQNYILNTSAQNGGVGGQGLTSSLPANASPSITLSGPGYTDGLAGHDLTVTVTAQKYWFVIDNFIPGLGSHITITVSTDMKVE